MTASPRVRAIAGPVAVVALVVVAALLVALAADLVRWDRTMRDDDMAYASRASATWDRIPGTSAQRATAGTISRPWASFPIVAGGPPPEANTRSNSCSLSFAAARKSSTTRTTPRRMATSRIISAAQASIWSSDCSARRARYSVVSAERPVAPTGPPGRAMDSGEDATCPLAAGLLGGCSRSAWL